MMRLSDSLMVLAAGGPGPFIITEEMLRLSRLPGPRTMPYGRFPFLG